MRSWVLAAALLAWAAPAAARPRGAVIDLRGPEAPTDLRETERGRLGAQVDLIHDPALAAALVGAPDPGPRAAADAELTAASDAYGKLDCPAAGAHADAAARAFLVLGDPADLRAPLTRALALILLCADSTGDRSAAGTAARRLRALGADPPDGVPAAVWARYPEIDVASNVTRGPVRIETDPDGAQIWIDLTAAGAAPVEQALMPGSHWVVAAAPGRARSLTEIRVKEGKSQTVHLALASLPPDAWAAVRQRVVDLRERPSDELREGSPSGGDLAAVMRESGIDVAVVLTAGHASVWFLKPDATAAAQAETVEEAVRALAATPVEATPAEPKRKKRPRWIYGAVIGGVLLAAGFVYLLDAGTDTQRIEVSWP